MYQGFAGGLTKEDCLEIAQIHEKSGLIDFLNLNYGRVDTSIGYVNLMPGMSGPTATYLDRVQEFGRELTLPVFHACRIIDAATARRAIREGIVDMVGMTGMPGCRASIADLTASMTSDLSGDGSLGVGSSSRLIMTFVSAKTRVRVASTSSAGTPGIMRQLMVAFAVCGKALSAWPAFSRVATQVVRITAFKPADLLSALMARRLGRSEAAERR